MSEKVVFLAYSNPSKLEKDMRDCLACKKCRNKTFLLVWQGDTAFPLLECAACHNYAGYWGFAGDEQPDTPPSTEEEQPPPA